MGATSLLELYGDAALARRIATGLIGEGVEDVWLSETGNPRMETQHGS